jgi:hypothetical protein
MAHATGDSAIPNLRLAGFASGPGLNGGSHAPQIDARDDQRILARGMNSELQSFSGFWLGRHIKLKSHYPRFETGLIEGTCPNNVHVPGRVEDNA